MPAKPKTPPKRVGRKLNRLKTERTRSSAVIGITAGAVAILGGLAAAFRFGAFDRATARATSPDQAPDTPPIDGSARAPQTFRPDPAAPIAATGREAYRPAKVPIGGTPDGHTDVAH